jgi:8-oxo-dGTP pyrophosphatase MutT (NUDIX family)
MSTSLKKIKSFTKHNPINSVLILFNGTNHILTVTERNGTVGFPGGRIERHDPNPFKAMIREYEEETGHNLPDLYNIKKFIYKNQTAIFVAYTPNDVPEYIGPYSDGEIINIKIRTVSEINDALDFKTVFKLRTCVINSTKLLFMYLGLRFKW